MKLTPKKVVEQYVTNDPPTEEDFEALRSMRPKTRADCKDGLRPCPFVGCRYHLYMEVGSGQSKTILPNFMEADPLEIPETCALDFADKNGKTTLDAVGKALNLTRERIRQIQKEFIRVLKKDHPDLYDLFVDMQN